jgi:hypothetical protein
MTWRKLKRALRRLLGLRPHFDGRDNPEIIRSVRYLSGTHHQRKIDAARKIS